MVDDRAKADDRKQQNDLTEDAVRAVVLALVQRIVCDKDEHTDQLHQVNAPTLPISTPGSSPDCAKLSLATNQVAGELLTANKGGQAKETTTQPPPRRVSRRASATLAQRNVAARRALASAYMRTSKADRVGTPFDTCQVGKVACTAIEVSLHNRLALVEQCSNAVLGNLARRNDGWSGELIRLCTSSRQIFLVAEDEVKSTAVFSRRADSQALVIHLFGTAEPCQRQGYGTALLRILQKYASGMEIFVEVGTDRIPAWWLSKAFLGTEVNFSKPRLWNTTALLRWAAETEALCTVCKRGQNVHLCPFHRCSYESHRTCDMQHHIQSTHAEHSATSSRVQHWQESTSFRGVPGAPGQANASSSFWSAAAVSAIKQPTATVRKPSSKTGRQRIDQHEIRNKCDKQEQKWVRKIIALAKQTDKSNLPTKAKMLFRMMKADLCKDATSSEDEDEDVDEDSEDSHICNNCGRAFSSKSGLGNHRRHW